MKKRNKPKQTTMDMFLKRKTRRQEESQEGLSGDIPEEGIVITRDNSFMCVIAPDDPPVGQDVETVILMILVLY